MRRHLLGISCALFAAFPAGAGVFSASQEQTAARFVVHVMNCKFDSAIGIADSSARADTLDPFGPVLRLMALGMRDLDYEVLIDTAGFLATYRQTVERVLRYEEKHGRSSYTMTIAGLANATHAAFYLRQKRYFSAIGTGLDAIKMLHEAKAADSTNYDVDFFLGLYDFGKAELRKRLWMVMFWYGGDKEDGIRRLRDCARGAQIAGPAAEISLADIYIKEKRYDSALVLLDTLIRRYPGSRFVMWERAECHEAREDFAAAAETYGGLSRMYAQSRHGTYNSIATGLKQVVMLCRAGKHTAARRTLRTLSAGACAGGQWRDSEACAEIRKRSGKGACHDSD